jgi:hypothetical protein
MTNAYKNATLEDIIADPKKFGAPTFQEFKRDPSKYRVDWAAIADNGSKEISKNQIKQTYLVCGHKADTIEKAETIAADYGYNLSEMKISPQMIPEGGGKYNVVVEFIPRILNATEGPPRG